MAGRQIRAMEGWRGLHGRIPAPRRQRSVSAPLGVGRATLRLALPDALLERIVQAAVCAESSPTRSFGPLEARVHAFVFGELPESARTVRLRWDPVRREVRASFRVEGFRRVP